MLLDVQDGLDFVLLYHETVIYNYNTNKIDSLQSSLLTKF